MEENVGMPLCDIRALQAERDEYIRQYNDLFSIAIKQDHLLQTAVKLLTKMLKGQAVEMITFREDINTFLSDVKELRDVKDCSSN